MVWTGFIASLLVLLYVSRINLALGLFGAALTLGIFTSSLQLILDRVYLTFSDPCVVYLSIVVFFMPLIGGILEESGQMDDLVANMRIGKKWFLALSPALLGMLPMPGGALLSAPLVEKGGKEITPSLKASINVWFRHILFLVYPLAPALIASARIAELEVYQVIPYLFPALIFSLALGYFFFLKDIQGRMEYQDQFSFNRFIPPIAIILTAPSVDLTLKIFSDFKVPEIATLMGVLASLGVGLFWGRIRLKKLFQIGKAMAPWKFALIIFGMFTFLNIFTTSGVPQLIADIKMPLVALCVLGGYLLGVITGRIQAPMSILVPIYLARFGNMTPLVFSFTFFSVFLGYCVSPIHPCVSVSIEYFKTSIRKLIITLVPPTLLGLAVLVLASIFWL